MYLAIGIILVVIGFTLNQLMSNLASKDKLSRPLFFMKPNNLVVVTILYIVIYLIGLYFLFRVNYWIPIILVGLYLLLIVSNLIKGKK